MTPSVRRPSSAQLPGGLQWYIIKVHSGREKAVKEAFQRRVLLEGLQEVVGRVLIPVEKVAEFRNGRRTERTRKLFSGYLLCEIALDDRVLALLREVPGVNDFLRSGATPVPLSPSEAQRFVAERSEGKINVIRPDFDSGDRVRLLRGAFAQMEGEVTEVLADTGQVRVRVTILGRPVLLNAEAPQVLRLT
jgi:transcriptional antiterminator NusG